MEKITQLFRSRSPSPTPTASNVVATLDFNDPIIKRLNEKLAFSQKEIFIQNFYFYLTIEDKKAFSVDFEDVWKWMGYSKKANAKARFDNLVNKGVFVEEIDFVIMLRPQLNSPNTVGPPIQDIRLTVACFKKFGVKCGTEKGEELIDYFVVMEEIVLDYTKERLAIQQQQLANFQQLQIEKDTLISKQQLELVKAEKKIKDMGGEKDQYFYLFRHDGKVKAGISDNLDITLQTYRRAISLTEFDWTYQFNDPRRAKPIETLLKSLFFDFREKNNPISSRIFLQHRKIVHQYIEQTCILRLFYQVLY
jgi:phage anti-repressor protein